MSDKKCPRCGLWNTASALRCDCGYDFRTEAVEESYNKEQTVHTSREGIRTLLWSINIIFGLLVLAWPIGMLTSIVLFDAPGSLENPILHIAAWSIRTYPVTYFIALFGSVILYSQDYNKTSVFFSILPIINILGVGFLAFLWLR